MADATFHFHDISDWVKKHPYTTAGIVFVGGAVLIYLYYSSAASPVAATVAGSGASDADAEYQAELQAEEEASASQNQATAYDDQYQLGVTSINAAASIAALNDQTDLGIASLNATSLEDSIAAIAGVDSLSASLNASVASQQITANLGADTYSAYEGSVQNITDTYLNTVGQYDTTALLTNFLTQQTNQQANVESLLIEQEAQHG